MAAAARFKKCSAEDFNFKRAPIYRKSAILKKSQVKIAARATRVATALHGVDETRNVARVGDRIITGPAGERYVIAQRQFHKLYEWIEKPPHWRSKNRVRALELERNTQILAPWGEKQRALKGAMIVQRVGAPRDIYLIDRTIFEQTYTPATAPKRTRSVSER